MALYEVKGLNEYPEANRLSLRLLVVLEDISLLFLVFYSRPVEVLL